MIQRECSSFQKLFFGFLFFLTLTLLTLPIQAATFTVDNLGDGGDSNAGDGNCNNGSDVCTLRAAIEESNANSVSDTINFSVDGTIQLTTWITVSDNSTIIDGGSNHDVIIRGEGTSYANNFECLEILSSQNTIKGLVFHNCSIGVALSQSNSTNNTVQNNYFGLTTAGTSTVANGRGVRIEEGANHNLVGGSLAGERNYFGGEVSQGININGVGSNDNKVKGNYFGIGTDGTTNLTCRYGIYTANGASRNIIGTDGDGVNDATEGNVVTNCSANGIRIKGTNENAGNDNRVSGNIIGLKPDGETIAANNIGLQVDSETDRNATSGAIIGTNGDGVSDALERNIISGNTQYGIRVRGKLTTNVTIAGNYIGTTSSGNVAAANGIDGVLVDNGASNVTIGTDGDGTSDELERNVVAGNAKVEIRVKGTSDELTQNNIVAGNYVGLGADGTTNLAVARTYGISLWQNSNSRVGTNGDGTSDVLERNVVVGDGSGSGIVAGKGGPNLVAGNYVGLDANGDSATGRYYGINVSGSNNTIGYDNVEKAAVMRNIVANQVGWGIHIIGTTATGNKVRGNYVGTNPAGDTALANSIGVGLYESSSNIIGPDNVISGNNTGLLIHSRDAAKPASQNHIYGNLIGLQPNGNDALPNKNQGVQLSVASGGVISQNIIGTNGDGVGDAGERNIIAGNTNGMGIETNGAGVQNNTIAGNYIGINKAGDTAVPNWLGVRLLNTSSQNIVGFNGTSNHPANMRNVISGNRHVGIQIRNSANNKIAGNYIGTDKDGVNDLGNSSSGIYIFDGASNNIIGGATTNHTNVIRFNGDSANEFGIHISNPSSQGNQILTNSIYDNQEEAIRFNSDGPHNRITAGSISAQANLATPVHDSLQLSGAVSHGTGGEATIQAFLANNASDCDPQTFIGQTTTTDGTWKLTLTGDANNTDQVITIIHTDTSDGSAVASDCFTIQNQAPTLGTVAGFSGAEDDKDFNINYADLLAKANETDANGDTVSFRIEAISNGSVTKSGNAVSLGSTLLAGGESLAWSPVLNSQGSIPAFKVVAYDGGKASASSVDVTIDVTKTIKKAPIARVKGPKLMASGKDFVFNGSESSDPDGFGLTYEWTVTGAAEIVGASNASTVSVKAGAQTGPLTVSLKVSNAKFSASQDFKTRVVNPKKKTSDAPRIKEKILAIAANGKAVTEDRVTNAGEFLRTVHLSEDIDFITTTKEEITIIMQEGYALIADPKANGETGYVLRIDLEKTKGQTIDPTADPLIDGVVMQQGSTAGDLFGLNVLVHNNQILVHSPATNEILIYNSTLTTVQKTIRDAPSALFMVVMDIDDDKKNDLAIGSRFADDKNAVKAKVLILSQALELDFNEVQVVSNLSDLPDDFDLDDEADYTITNDKAFFSGTKGDVNGDGLYDLVLSSMDDCQVLIYYGHSGFEAAQSEDNADVKINGNDCDGQFGFNLASGDLTGDGIDDIAIVSRQAGDDKQGAVQVVYGADDLAATIDLSTEDDAVHASVEGSSPQGQLGESLTLSDANGDGVLDIVASEQTQEGENTVVISFLGNSTLALQAIEGEGQLPTIENNTQDDAPTSEDAGSVEENTQDDAGADVGSTGDSGGNGIDAAGVGGAGGCALVPNTESQLTLFVCLLFLLPLVILRLTRSPFKASR